MGSKHKNQERKSLTGSRVSWCTLCVVTLVRGKITPLVCPSRSDTAACSAAPIKDQNFCLVLEMLQIYSVIQKALLTNFFTWTNITVGCVVAVKGCVHVNTAECRRRVCSRFADGVKSTLNISGKDCQ